MARLRHLWALGQIQL